MTMIFTDENNRIKMIHYKPEKLSEERQSEGYEVEEIPEKPSTDRGERAIAYYDEDKEEVYYEIEKRKLSREEKRDQYLETLAKITTGDKIRADELSSENIVELVELYPKWKTDKEYKENDLVTYKGEMYEVIQDHTSQEDWLPNESDSLYTNKLPDDVVAKWVQPTGSHDAYDKGDQVKYNGETWESEIDDNVWEPGIEGWKKVE